MSVAHSVAFTLGRGSGETWWYNGSYVSIIHIQDYKPANMKQYHLSTGISLDSRSIKTSSTTTSAHSTRQFQASELVSCGMRCSKERIWFPSAPFLPLLRPKSPSSSCPEGWYMVGENFDTAPKCQKLNVLHQDFHKFMFTCEWWFVTQLLGMNFVKNFYHQ